MNSLFKREVWKKLEANKDKIKYKFNVPFFVEREDGVVIVPTIAHEITNTNQLEEYEKKVRKYYDYIKDTYPEQSKVVRVLDNTLARLTDPSNSTKIGRILSGQPIKNSAVFSMSYELDASNAFVGFLSTYNRDFLGFEGRKEVLPRVRRSKSTLVNLFNKNKKGFFVPEIDEKGLVVRPGSRNQAFEVNLVAVNSKDITEQQFENYITAPFGNRQAESGVPFGVVKDLAREAYASIGTSELSDKVEALLNVCMHCYPYSFKAVKKDKKQPEVAPVETVVEERKPIRVPVKKIVRKNERPVEERKPVRVPVRKVVREEAKPVEERKPIRVPVKKIIRKNERPVEMEEELIIIAKKRIGIKKAHPAQEIEIAKPVEIVPNKPMVESVARVIEEPKKEIESGKSYGFGVEPVKPKRDDEIQIGKPYKFDIELVEEEPAIKEESKKTNTKEELVSDSYYKSPIIDTRTGKSISESPVKILKVEEVEQERE